MTKRELILYIAMSLDGYIATEEGDIGWLSLVERPNEDYGYFDFAKTVDTVIMGRKTYDKVLSFGIEFPHKDKKCYVLSKSKTGRDENVEYFAGDAKGLIDQIRQQEGKHLYCDGGAETVAVLLKQGLIDKMVISIIPVLLGNGIRLFQNGQPTTRLQLVGSQSFPSGLVQVTYQTNTTP